MATETLRLDISVQQKQALAELKLMDDRLLILQKQLKKTTDTKGIIQLQDEIRGLKREMDALSQTASGNVVKGSNQAANALTNLGRVAQDAPFGFIGIQNNLNPLLESFTRLKTETGSTSGALKSLAGSLIGPAGLGLALSVGSALLVAFGDKLTEASKETKMLDAAQKALVDTLSKGLGEARAEAGQLQMLSKIITDTAQSTEVRARALQQLKDEYPGYEALQKVDIKDTAALAKITDVLTAALMRKARVEAYSSLIAAEEAKQAKIALENDKQRTDRLGFLSQAIKKYAVPLLGLIDPTNANIAATKLQIDGLDKAGEEYDFNQKLITTYQGKLTSLTVEQLKNNDATILGGAAQEKQTEKIHKAKKAVEDYTARIAAARASFQSLGQGQQVTALGQPDTSFQPVGPNDAMVQRTQQVMALTKVQMDYQNSLRLTAMNEEIAAAGAAMATSAFTSLGQALLMGQDFGEALSNTFKRIIIDLTQMVVKAMLFKAIMASLTGGTSEIAGAAGGGGGFLGNLFKGLLGFADGGVVSGPKSGYPVMLHGTEAVLNPKQFKNLTSNMMNMGALQSQGGGMNLSGEFVVRGNDLVYVLNKQGFTNNLLGR